MIGIATAALVAIRFVGPCLDNPDTTAILIAQIRQNIPLADSGVQTIGRLPSHVEMVRRVTAPEECAAGVKALFAPMAPPGMAFTGEAYVFALDTVGYVVVAGGGVKEYTYFDTRWKRVAVLESLD